MRKTVLLAGLATLLSTAAACVNAAPDADAARWQAMAATDLDAVHARILEAHPGVIDAENPGFNTWVEQGYAQAKAYLPQVMSYDTALAVIYYYTSGFQDGHLVESDDIRGDFPMWVTGWNIAWRQGAYRVVATMPGWSVPLPPMGAQWTGCDGLGAEDTLQAVVAPFTDRRAGEESRNRRARMLWMQRPVTQNLRQCSFRTASGEVLDLPVAYAPVTTDQWFAAQPDAHEGGFRSPNAFDLRDGVLWIRAGNFNLRDGSADRAELETLLARLATVSGARAIVFDSRGNLGGDSSIGDRIFEAATGGLEFDRTGLEALPWYHAQWRVSDYLVGVLDRGIEQRKALYGVDSPRVAEDIAFRDRVLAARKAGAAWVEQDAGRTITRADVVARHGQLRRFDGRVALLTDGNCVSACLDFADVVLQVPGVVHVGRTTGADSVYLVGSRSTMPSGNALVMPVKVWRNRPRGNNEALVPQVVLDIDRDEASLRADVLRALGI